MSELKLQQCRLDGRYDIIECLGRGSYAEVYLAHDAAAHDGSPQLVVIKALNLFLQGALDLELERTLIENFRNEAIALDRVRHPHIISRLGHGTAIDLAGQTFHYLVLEYLPGGDMATLCRREALTLDRALFYLEQVCSGLAYAHEHGVIHRDIKPQNLLLTADQQTLKIADFGVAKIEADEGAITRVGTDVYAAPEHHPLMQTAPLDTAALTRPAAHLTPAADIFSLGKTAYRMLTGEAPRRFSQKPITELPPQSESQSWASFVLRVLRRATDVEPSKRYQTVKEFWEELRDATMPKTQLLARPGANETRQFVPRVAPAGVAPMPPEPLPARFDVPERAPARHTDGRVARPRIVVPVAAAQPLHDQQRELEPSPSKPPLGHAPTPDKSFAWQAKPDGSRSSVNARRWLVALALIAAFAAILLAIHHKVRNLRPATANSTTPATTNAPVSAPALQVGREMYTITSVNLRSGPSKVYDKIGVAERGSRVRILQLSNANNWCEVQVLQQGGTGEDPNSASQGWLDGTKLR